MNKKIVCIGDSITYGFPFGPDYSWVNFGVKKYGHLVRIINQGINGDTSLGVKGRFQKDVIDLKPAMVILTIGTNDAWIERDRNIYIEMVKKCCQRANEAGIEMILGIPVPVLEEVVDDILSDYRDELNSLSAKTGMKTLDFYTRFTALDPSSLEMLYDDDFHPSQLGYRAMGEIFTNFLKDILV